MIHAHYLQTYCHYHCLHNRLFDVYERGQLENPRGREIRGRHAALTKERRGRCMWKSKPIIPKVIGCNQCRRVDWLGAGLKGS
jgi:hypothetical protein